MSDRVGTPAQVAEKLETGEDSVRWLKAERGLPFVMINRTQWVVPWDALDRWLAENENIEISHRARQVAS